MSDNGRLLGRSIIVIGCVAEDARGVSDKRDSVFLFLDLTQNVHVLLHVYLLVSMCLLICFGSWFNRLLSTFYSPFLKDDLFQLRTLLWAHILDLRWTDTLNIHLLLDAILSQSDGLSHLEHLFITKHLNVTHKIHSTLLRVLRAARYRRQEV